MFEDGIFMHNFMFLKGLHWNTRCFALKIGTKSMSFFHYICRFILHFRMFFNVLYRRSKKCTFMLTCGTKYLQWNIVSADFRSQWSKIKLEMFIPSICRNGEFHISPCQISFLRWIEYMKEHNDPIECLKHKICFLFFASITLNNQNITPFSWILDVALLLPI